MTSAGFGTDEAPFTGAKALIFGGAKGIGRCVALERARRGASLAVADIDEHAAKTTVAGFEGGDRRNPVVPQAILAAMGAGK